MSSATAPKAESGPVEADSRDLESQKLCMNYNAAAQGRVLLTCRNACLCPEVWSQGQIARDFGISTHSVQRWLKQADIDEGVVEGTTRTEQQELVELRRRNRDRQVTVTGIPSAARSRTSG